MDSNRKILIVDDEPDLCRILQFNLDAEGFDTLVAHSGAEALTLAATGVDLVLLDVMMPELSGFEVARRLRQREDTARVPIIFLTALDGEDDVLGGFGAGADDCVSKPFSVKELLARIRAVLARAAAHAPTGNKVAYGGLVADDKGKLVTVDGEPVAVTRTEFDLLWLLLTHRGQVYSRAELIAHVWPRGVVVSDRTVDVNITRLRKKIEPYGQCVCTRQGYGYYFCV